MKKQFITYYLLLTTLISFSQYNESYKCYPQHWWAGMKMNNIQLMMYGDAIKNADGFTINYPGIKITKVSTLESDNYAFIDIAIAPNTKPGVVKIIPKGFNGTSYIKFEIKPREKGSGVSRIRGVTSEDLIYLLMPDRFSNGDASNDFYADMKDTGHDRNNPFDRHGGDLQGVINHLDYVKDLGATAIWMTPVVENDMARTLEAGTLRSTYHGYAFTNHYQIDKRFGGNEIYKKLIDEAHSKGLKIIQDAVYNHAGIDHFIAKDLPAKDWLNQWPTYTNTSYREHSLPDIYSSAYDRKITTDGWFTTFMIDWNQKNKYVANYLIQHAIWTTEEFGIDGWRVDTYFYSDPSFLNKINEALYTNFPTLTMFGENSVNNVANSAYFCENNMNVPFKHNAQGTLDFPFAVAAQLSFKEQPGWSEGIHRIHQVLGQDYLYKNPMRNCIFLDNHDWDRVYSVLGEDIKKMKAAHTLLLTQRGIPHIYYGDEILTKNFKDPTDAEVRKDFPGGWAEDNVNKFEASGRTVQENDFFNYLKKLANYRKTSSALKTGKLMQYVPQDGLYVYFRYDAKQTVMIIINTAKTDRSIKFSDYNERTTGFTNWNSILDGNNGSTGNSITIESMDAKVIELSK